MTILIEKVVKNRNRWLILPGTGGVVVMAGSYLEGEVMDFINNTLLRDKNYNGEMSFTVHKVIASVFRCTQEKMPTFEQNLLDFGKGHLMTWDSPSTTKYRVSIKSPFWMKQGSGTSGIGNIIVENVCNNVTHEIFCQPDGKNGYGKQVLTWE